MINDMNFFKKIFGKSDKDDDVEITVDMPYFKPQEDITAYELSQYLLLNRNFVFRGDVQKFQNEIMNWYYVLPPSLARHFSFGKRTFKVSKSLVTSFIP